MLQRYHLRQESISLQKSQAFMCALLCFKEKVLSTIASERGRNIANQRACHSQLKSLWNTLVFNHPILPASCSHLTSFAQGVSRPIKTPSCAVKAFEVAYASELEILKATDNITLGIAKKTQRNKACVGTCIWKLQFLQNKTQLFSNFRVLQDEPCPVLKTKRGKKET